MGCSKHSQLLVAFGRSPNTDWKPVSNKILAATTVFVTALLLAGCSAPPSDEGADSLKPVAAATVEPTPSPTPTSEWGESVRNDHDNLVKVINQLAGTTASYDDDVVTSRFTVTGFKLDPECNSGFSEGAANGHYLRVDLHIETTPELAKESSPTMSFDEYGWNAYNADGTRLNDPIGNAWSCLDSSLELPMNIGPGEVVDGSVILDVKDATGSVALTFGGPAGWEWTY